MDVSHDPGGVLRLFINRLEVDSFKNTPHIYILLNKKITLKTFIFKNNKMWNKDQE